MARRKKIIGSTAVSSTPEFSGVTHSPHIDEQRVFRAKMARYSPIKNLSPETLTSKMDAFNTGYIRDFAILMDAVENRDDTIKNVAGKRKASIARREWTIMRDPTAEKDDPEVESHVEVLEYFYRNLTATNAIDRNERRGFSLLIKQMMDSIGKGWAVHELIWHPETDGLTATFNFVPLWFFENRYGDFRFLPYEGAFEGVPLEPEGWMVTCGPRLMEASVVAYLFKITCKRLELIYCEKHGMPGVQGKVNAPVGSIRYNAMKDAVAEFGSDFTCVTGIDDSIVKIDCASNGPLPYGTLIDRADKAIAALWRGADLSTISSGSGDGTGASLQGKEALIIEMDDAALISETLQMQIDRKVIEYHFGPGTRPRAYIKIVVPEPLEVDKETKVDDHLLANHIKLSKSAMLEMYGRSEPVDASDTVELPIDPSDPAAGRGGAPAPGAGGAARAPALSQQDMRAMANERIQEDRKIVRKALEGIQNSTDIFKPILDRLDAVYSFEGKAFEIALNKFRVDLPELSKDLPDQSPIAKALESAMTASFFNSLAETVVERHP